MSHQRRSFQGRLRSARDFAATLAADAVDSVRKWSLARWASVLLACAAVAAFMLLVDVPSLETLRAGAHSLGPWFIFAFGLGYVIFTLFPIPRTVWTVSSGILFGPWAGMAVSLTALTCSAMIAFLVVRNLLGDWIRPRLKHPAVASIDARLAARGWLAIASLRMVAAAPFSLVNYVAALTRIPLSQFTAATALGSIPTTALGVFFGDALISGSNPWIILTMALLALLGIAGLVLDSKLPAPRR